MPFVRYPVATLDGEFVWAAELATMESRPTGLTCVGCDDTVRLRAGAKNRPHFAHIADAACPGGETALHRTTIRVLQQAILDAAENERPYHVHCGCDRCDAERLADLARPGCSIAIDQVLEDGIRPDLLIRSRQGTPLAVIEVIVTHEPEPAALAVFERLGLPTIRVWPTWDTLAELRHGLGADLELGWNRSTGCFDVTGACRSPRHRSGTVPCPNCLIPARQLSVETAHAECWVCHKQYPVLDLIDCTDNQLVLVAAGCPEVPNAQVIGTERGVRRAVKHSKAAGGSYLIHLCTNCRRIQGDNFVYDSRGAVTDVTAPAWSMTLCENGHLERGADLPWPRASVARRPTLARGLVGENANLFRPEEALRGFAVTQIGEGNRRQLINMMLGGWH